MGCGHSTQIPVYGETLLKYSYQIPTQILDYGHNTLIPVYGETLLKYSYQISDLVLGCRHSTQFPLYGGIITQVFLPNPCSNI
jgi:hypothetical protein